MKLSSSLTDSAVQQELGLRLSKTRLARSLTQAQLAKQAGISKRTLERLEAGENTQLHNLLRVLRVLNLLDNLEVLVPDDGPRPMDLLRLHKPRMRASKQTGGEVRETWQWGDEEDEEPQQKHGEDKT